jgi:hypothetical protein
MAKTRVVVPAGLVILAVLVFALPVAPTQSRPMVEWDSLISGQMFPAAILANAGTPGKSAEGSVLCDPKSSMRIRVRSSKPQTHIHVDVKMDYFFADTSSCDAVLERPGQVYVVAPTPRWDAHRLAYNDQSYPTTVVINVRADGQEVGQKTQRLQMRAVNDVPLGALDEGQRLVNWGPALFGAFVNENSPVVETLLSEAKKWNAVAAFTGYDGGAEGVLMQVFAIWNALQHRGVKFASIARPSGYSEAVASQTVRFLEQTVRDSQANCVDGSVLFASVLYKIGIEPVLVLKPGHMFVGYYLENHLGGPNVDPRFSSTTVAPVTKDLVFLETTMVGQGPPLPNRPFDKAWPLDCGTDLKCKGELGAAAKECEEKYEKQDAVQECIMEKEFGISYREFNDATQAGNDEFYGKDKDDPDAVLPHWLKQEQLYTCMRVRNLRARGINPIPR